MDLLDSHAARVMLTGREGPAFDDPDYIFEIKVDGDRCLAYLDGSRTVLINKRGRNVDAYFPELATLHTLIGRRCILDGELIFGAGSKRDFELIRSRQSTKDARKRERDARVHPATFLIFDLLYLDLEPILDRPLTERKALLEEVVTHNERLALSRVIHGRGREFFTLATEQGLEGIMAKKADSPYLMGKRSPEWMKCKNWDRDMFVVCGYTPSEKANVASLVLAQYRQQTLVYVGSVVIGRNRSDYGIITAQPRTDPYLDIPGKHRDKMARLEWIEPRLVCQVEFVCRTSGGGLRQPAFRGLLPDYSPDEARWPEAELCGDPPCSTQET